MSAPLATPLSPADLRRLRWATTHLEHPSLAVRLTNAIGAPIEIVVKLLPRPLYCQVHAVVDAAVGKLMDAALASLRLRERREGNDPRIGLYRGLAVGSGAVGGFFGLYGLLAELPVSTTLMLRSIAEIARAEGEDLDDPEARLACLEVFALGGHSERDDAAETGYYGVRLALAVSVTRAAGHLAEYGLGARAAPALVELIELIATRFGARISETLAARIVPVIGAAGAAAVNWAFMCHYQDMARGHFVVRSLERRYGREAVQACYEAIRRGEGVGA